MSVGFGFGLTLWVDLRVRFACVVLGLYGIASCRWVLLVCVWACVVLICFRIVLTGWGWWFAGINLGGAGGWVLLCLVGISLARGSVFAVCLVWRCDFE